MSVKRLLFAQKGCIAVGTVEGAVSCVVVHVLSELAFTHIPSTEHKKERYAVRVWICFTKWHFFTKDAL